MTQEVEIHIEGQLDPSWAEWLDGFSLTYSETDETILTGPIVDQAALYGLLSKMRDLGVRLISVNLGEQDIENPSAAE